MIPTRSIQLRLSALEDQEHMRILYACESGSRAWGFESSDSDFDVRFLYARPIEWYLSIDEKRDVIERPLDKENVDLSGWDLKKALVLLRKSNPPLLEWLQFPIVYTDNFEVRDRLKTLSSSLYCPIGCMHHYLSMAERNFSAYLEGDVIRTKKYFYVLRPILACCWIEAGLGVAPIEFKILLDRFLPNGAVRAEIDVLVKLKQRGSELDEGARSKNLHQFLEEQLQRLSQNLTIVNSRREPEVDLNRVFREILMEVWKKER